VLFLVPCDIGRHHGSLLIHVLLVFGSLLVVEETHHRAVGYEGNNAVRFILEGLEAANPGKDDEDGHSQKIDAEPLDGLGVSEAFFRGRACSRHIRL